MAVELPRGVDLSKLPKWFKRRVQYQEYLQNHKYNLQADLPPENFDTWNAAMDALSPLLEVGVKNNQENP